MKIADYLNQIHEDVRMQDFGKETVVYTKSVDPQALYIISNATGEVEEGPALKDKKLPKGEAEQAKKFLDQALKKFKGGGLDVKGLIGKIRSKLKKVSGGVLKSAKLEKLGMGDDDGIVLKYEFDFEGHPMPSTIYISTGRGVYEVEGDNSNLLNPKMLDADEDNTIAFLKKNISSPINSILDRGKQKGWDWFHVSYGTGQQKAIAFKGKKMVSASTSNPYRKGAVEFMMDTLKKQMK